jgi:hypothetical protein
MDKVLNLGKWKVMENSWEQALKLNKKVKIDIRPIYDGDDLRPKKFEVRYQIGDEAPKFESFNNNSNN